MEAAAQGMRCALCGDGADVQFAADAAFLCGGCDAQVHGANFLASRHRRTRVSQGRRRVRDVVHLLLLHSRIGDHGGHGAGATKDVSGTTSSTSCVSTADSATTAARQHGRTTKPRRTRRGRGEAVLQGWAKRMGIVAPGAACRAAATAARALQDVAAAPRLPLRVAMAAALWHEVAAHEADGDALRRLESGAHVPARLVVAVASSMERARLLKQAAAADTEEGWGDRASARARDQA